MNYKVLNIVLLVILAMIVGATFLFHGIPTKRNVEILPGMLYPVPYEPQSDPLPSNAGNAPFNAVPGTISRDVDLFPSSTLLADSSFDPAELRNPFTLDSGIAVQRGQRVFGIYCSPCHGAGGAGDGEIAKRGYPPPPSLLAPNAHALSDGEMFRIVTQGKGNMPSYLSQMADADRWMSVLYIRSLQTDAQANTTAAPDTSNAPEHTTADAS
ncbi:MAG: cytochrome C [Ectothiorhodospiraceae bacterium]|nr:cytochrome C [Ectothiorhodospiraceae bacterium]